MNTNNDRRTKIRAYFFPLSRPDEPKPPTSNAAVIIIGVFTIFCLLGVIWSTLRIISEIFKPSGTEEAISTYLVFLGLFTALPIFTFINWWRDEKRKKKIGYRPYYKNLKTYKDYEEKLNDYLHMAKRWNISEEDLALEVSTAEIDKWLQEDMKAVVIRALDKLGLTQGELVRNPLVIYGPLFWSTYGIPDDDLVTVKLTDGSLRFSCYQLVVVCLSAERIATYTADFNFLRNVFVNEKCIEFLYRDIISISTQEISTNYNLPNGKTMTRAQTFRVAVSNGDDIEVVINSPEIRDLLGGEAQLTDHDQSVRVIREMLRTKLTNK